MNVFRGILESTCLSVHPCVSPSMYLSVYKILAYVKALAGISTHSHTMTPFDAPGKQAFRKHCGKRRNCS